MTDIQRKKNTGEPTTNGGHFGSRANDDATVALGAAPVTIRIQREREVDRGYIEEIDTVEIDGRAILDALPLDRIDPDVTDSDDIFYTAERLGLVEHDGPFTVYLNDDSVREYIEQREIAGFTEPITGDPRRSREQIAEQRAALEAERVELEKKEFSLAMDEIALDILRDFPNAVKFDMWDLRDDASEAPDWRVANIMDEKGTILAEITELGYEHSHLSDVISQKFEAPEEGTLEFTL